MELILPDFTSGSVWMSLLTLTFLEIVLGIDNIIFISIASGKLKKEEQAKATNIGLLLAMFLRILLLFGISILVAMKAPWISFHQSWISGAFSGQSLILIGGGLFLLYKSTSEIHHKLEGEDHEVKQGGKKKSTIKKVIMEITIINIIFSFDSILTAVGMTNGVAGALVIMIVAVVLSVLIMMMFAVPVGRFVNDHPSIQVLGLSFLILIGFMLIAEGAHIADFSLFGSHIGTVPKGYLYFAISFSLMVEFLNMKMASKKSDPVQLHGISEEAEDMGMYDEENEK